MTEPTPVTLEEVTADEWELWRDLRFRCLAADPDAFGSTLELEQAYDESDWRARMARGRMVLARLDDEPVGIGGAFDETPELAWVVSMWVAPEARGLGIGAAILLDVVEAAVGRGSKVKLWVADDNPARRIYERAGFVDTGVREPIRPGADLLKSEMELPGNQGVLGRVKGT